MANNLKIKPSKFSFFKSHLEYLGFVVDPHGLRPQPAKVDGINKMAAPSNKKDIQVFLGMMGYYCQFIPNFSKHAEPIFRLLKKEAEFAWTEQCKIAFEYLKKCLVTNPILAYPDFEKEFIVQTDASQTAVGAVLSQIGADNLEHPVSFCSRTLNNHERNYSVTERECLAVIYACKQFRSYIHGTHFTVVTDHASLRWLQLLREPEGRLARWS